MDLSLFERLHWPYHGRFTEQSPVAAALFWMVWVWSEAEGECSGSLHADCLLPLQ